MPPEDRFVPRFAAEPPQELLPYGRWAADACSEEFLRRLPADRRRGRGARRARRDHLVPGPHLARAHVRARDGADRRRARAVRLRQLRAAAATARSPTTSTPSPTARPRPPSANPDWPIDLCDEVVGTWRGEQGKVAAMTLVWGRPLVDGGAVATAELADLARRPVRAARGPLHAARARRLPRRHARRRGLRPPRRRARARVALRRGRRRGRRGRVGDVDAAGRRARRGRRCAPTSSPGAIGKTDDGVPAAAHTVGRRAGPRRRSSRSARAWP